MYILIVNSRFADTYRIKSTGPQSISNPTYDKYGKMHLTSSNLTEDEFLAAGFSLGAVVSEVFYVNCPTKGNREFF